MPEPLHDFRFPGESDEYRSARDELLRAELELRRQAERVAAQRRALPLGGPVQSDYEFEQWDDAAGAPRTVRLSELFDDGKDTLYLYSFMVVPAEQGLPFVGPCPSCTSIIDCVDGAVPHLTQRISFAVAAKAPIEEFRAHAQSRGWRHARLLSANPSAYNRDYGSETGDGFQWPIANVFTRDGDGIRHRWSSELWWVPHDDGQGPRHVDYMWPLWGVLDRVPGGRGDFETSLSYG
jgi:predicted dithiol-disulfide oxidoreductase (DUF899 family)